MALPGWQDTTMAKIFIKIMHRKPCFVNILVSYKIYIASGPMTGTIQLALPSGQDHMIFINIII